LLYNEFENMANPNKIKKEELIERISKRSNVSRKETEDVLDAFEKVIIDAMREGKEAVLTGFGSFLARKRTSRMGVNPQNPSQRIKIPTVFVPKFKAGKTLKDSLKEDGSDNSHSEDYSGAVNPEA